MAPKGFFVGGGLFASYINIDIKDTEILNSSDRSFLAGGIRVHLGYQWVFDNGLNLGLLGGAKFTSVSSKELVDIHGIDPTFEFSIGYSW